MEMGLKGTEEGTATRVMSECVPAPTALPLGVSECSGVFHLGGGENTILPDLVVRGCLCL